MITKARALRTRVAAVSLWMAAGWCGAVPAQDDASSALPAVQTQGAVTYLSGGIGSDESSAIKAAFNQYALSLTFAVHGGGPDVYLASVPVTIKDAKGATVLDITTDGPYLLANLPAGTYRVTATYNGAPKSVTAKVVAKGHLKLSIVWQGQAPAQRPLVAPSTPAIVVPTGSVPTGSVPTSPTPPSTVIATTVTAPAVAAPTVSPSITTPSNMIGSESSPASPAAGSADAAVAAADSALPAVKTQGGIPYVSGGIGLDESEAIKAAQARYSLSLTFAGSKEGRAAYLSDIPVKVKDAGGSVVLDVVTDGPYLLIDLPPGTYSITATYDGKDKTSSAAIAPGRNAKLSFLW